MPLYELFVISKSGHQAMKSLKNVMRETSEMLMDAKSTIRKIDFMGYKPLPYRMKANEEYLYNGSYWAILFYGSTDINATIQEKLKYNDEIIRYTLLKRADTLKNMIRS